MSGKYVQGSRFPATRQRFEAAAQPTDTCCTCREVPIELTVPDVPCWTESARKPKGGVRLFKRTATRALRGTSQSAHLTLRSKTFAADNSCFGNADRFCKRSFTLVSSWWGISGTALLPKAKLHLWGTHQKRALTERSVVPAREEYRNCSDTNCRT